MTKNILANFLGRFWSILSNFAFIPLYIKYLGFESYSVISFTLMITGIMAVLDAGLTATLSREFSRKDNTDEEKYKVFTTLETTYLGIVFLCIGIVFFGSYYIATHWVKVNLYTPEEISMFIKIMSFEIGFQLLLRFYMGGLLGMERQVEANLYQIAWGIIRNAVVVLLIMYWPSLYGFFMWQTISTVVFALIFKIALQRKLFALKYPWINLNVDASVYKKVGNFAGGMMLISLVAAINTQLDKLTISKLLTLENLGYYTLAVSLSQGLIILVNPITTAILPRFTAMYSTHEFTKARELFSKTNLIISIVIFSIMTTMALFSYDLIWIWTGKNSVAEHTYQLVPVVLLAYAMIALQILPYTIAISNAYTKLNNILGIVSLLITIPGYIIATQYYGVMGAAAVFCGVQLITTVIYIYFINKKFLHINFPLQILFKQIILPIIITSVLSALFAALPHPYGSNRVFGFLYIGFGIVLNMVISIMIFIPLKVLKGMINRNPIQS